MTANLIKQTDFDAIIIGGGACGLMCAVQAGFLGKRTLILEKNDRPGATANYYSVKICLFY